MATKYKYTRGQLQSLQQMASTFAGVVTHFCTALNWNLLALIIGQFKERLFFGVHRDLIDLMRLQQLNGVRARALFDGGWKNLAELANANVLAIERILFDCVSFDAKRRDGESEFEAAQRNKVRCLYVTGRTGLTIREAAKLMIEDARRYLESEMGVHHVQWSQSTPTETPIQMNSNANTNLALKPIMPESEDIFQTYSPTNLKRKSTDTANNVIQFDEPKGQDRRTSTRKSPRIEAQKLNSRNAKMPIGKNKQINSHQITPTKTDPGRESDCEIVQTPAQVQRNRSARIKNTDTKSTRRPIRPTASSGAGVPNPMRNQLIDVNDMDSIGFSRSHNSSSTSALNASHIMSAVKQSTDSPDELTSLDKIQIVNVCGSAQLFSQFSNTVATSKVISMAVAVAHNMPSSTRRTHVIGGNLLAQTSADESLERQQRKCVFDEDVLYVAGISFALDDSAASFYVDMQIGVDVVVPFSERIEWLTMTCSRSDMTIRMYDAKEQCKVLRKAIPSIREILCGLEDPRIAYWLLHADGQAGLKEMAQQFAPECTALCALGGDGLHNGSISLNYLSDVEPRRRAAVESCILGMILAGQKENLHRMGNGDILKSFIGKWLVWNANTSIK